MGNTALSRRNSLFKQDSQGERRMTVSSRQNTLLEEEVTTVKKSSPFPEPLTDGQKQLLIDTWKILEEDIAKVGVITFIRLVQYASKIAWYILKENNAPASSVDKIANLEYLLSNFRRILRLGRCLDTLYSAMNLIHYEDRLISFNCAVSKIAYSMFLLCDHVIWFGRAGLADVDTSRWNRIANKYWLFTIFMNLTRDYFEIKRLLLSSKILIKCKGTDPRMTVKKLMEFSETHKDVVLDLVKNSCDIFIPLAALNYVNLSPATIGLLGVISSVVGVYTVVDPFAKLPLT